MNNIIANEKHSIFSLEKEYTEIINGIPFLVDDINSIMNVCAT